MAKTFACFLRRRFDQRAVYVIEATLEICKSFIQSGPDIRGCKPGEVPPVKASSDVSTQSSEDD